MYHDMAIRAETNSRFVRIFARLLTYSRVFKCTVNDFSALILAYFVNDYKFKDISVIK